MKQQAVVLNDRDNVATALANLEAGASLEPELGGRVQTIRLLAPVIKYGEVIGVATSPIQPGDYVHVHNVASTRGRGDLVGREG